MDYSMCQTSLFSTVSQSFLKLMFIESMMPSKHLILCHPLLFLPSIFPSIRAFSSESVHIRWPKYWNFSFSICPSNEYSELISLGLTGFDLLAVQGILKSFQHHSLTASIFWCSSFFIIQLSHPYMTTGKTTSLSAKWCLCFLIYCLGLSQLFFQGASVFLRVCPSQEPRNGQRKSWVLFLKHFIVLWNSLSISHNITDWVYVAPATF